MSSLDDLLSHLLSLENPFVLGHESADPDAVGAAFGVSVLLNAPMGFPGLSREGKMLLKRIGAPYELYPDVEGRDVVVVDTNRREKLGGIDIERARSVTVVDHHATESNIDGSLFIFPEFSSTSEIVLRLFLTAKKEIDERVRFALVSGILFDTKWLKVARGTTLEVLGRVLGNRSLDEYRAVFEEDVSERIAKLKALRKGEIVRIGDFLVAYTDAGSFEASVASILITAGADVAIAFSESSRGDRISIRVSRRALDMGITAIGIAETASELNASCGGHEGAAGCFAPPKRASEIVKAMVENIIKELRKRGVEGEVKNY